MLRWGAAVYAFMGVVAVVIAVVWREGSPLLHPEPWLSLPPAGAHAYSVALGAAIGGLVVMLTRLFARFAWARRLHRELRPFARAISNPGIVIIALLSAIGEELLFRGLLEPWLGLVPQALLFGVLHYLPGSSRWVWMVWATAMGLVLGVVFHLTGSLTGAIAAHALVNGFNLHYLKNHDPEPPRRALGGLLGKPS
jgi:membrane protease YdiL (CAAX protease family)